MAGSMLRPLPDRSSGTVVDVAHKSVVRKKPVKKRSQFRKRSGAKKLGRVMRGGGRQADGASEAKSDQRALALGARRFASPRDRSGRSRLFVLCLSSPDLTVLPRARAACVARRLASSGVSVSRCSRALSFAP